ncbi:hypothetical protein [Rhizobium sp. LC145]|uniref:hypothetical protein n=1 Tax=Rhizobium sp. LC145 TaxID=1120688 RepID=UPI00062A3474|nr:hypothetical protein [Rhizobium sp. LC145]KKX26707.1 hypothetical protein YH62_23790 [Rhizobium sp. LC145]
MNEDEIIAAFVSQENIGLAVDHQDYAGDLVEDWNIDPREWIEENFVDVDPAIAERTADRINESGPWVYLDRFE